MSLLTKFKDKNIYYIADADLDGIGSTVVFEYFMRPRAKNIVIHNTPDREFPDLNWDFVDASDIVIFCDTTPNDIKIIEKIKEKSELYIFDHHITGRNLIGEMENYYYDITKCGTKILLDAFSPGRKKKSVKQFVELVNTYDTWQTEAPLWNEAFDLQNIMWGYVNWAIQASQTDYDKHIKFISMQLMKLHKYKNFFFTDYEKNIAFKAREKVKRNFKQAKKNISFRTDNSNNTYAYFSCTSKLSWVCHLLLKEYSDLDYIVGHSTWDKYNTKVSLRSKAFDTSIISTNWGGGGHEQASAFEFKKKNEFENFINNKIHLI